MAGVASHELLVRATRPSRSRRGSRSHGSRARSSTASRRSTFNATPAVEGDSLLIRSEKALYRIGTRKEGAKELVYSPTHRAAARASPRAGVNRGYTAKTPRSAALIASASPTGPESIDFGTAKFPSSSGARENSRNGSATPAPNAAPSTRPADPQRPHVRGQRRGVHGEEFRRAVVARAAPAGGFERQKNVVPLEVLEFRDREHAGRLRRVSRRVRLLWCGGASGCARLRFSFFPWAAIAARSVTFSSSRTFPGQWWAASRRTQSAPSGSKWRSSFCANRLAKLSARRPTSSPRSRSGGRRFGKTLRR